jgi:hypothetical protein
MAYPHNWVITVTTPNGINPKVQFGQGGKPLKSYPRFAFYLNNPGCTVGQYHAWCAAPAQANIAHKGIAALDLAWDTAHGFIKVAAPVATPALPAAALSMQAAIAAHIATPPVATPVAAAASPANAMPAPSLTKAQRKAQRKAKVA